MIIRKSKLDNIPIVEYFINDKNKKPLIYFFHGFTGNKDTLMGRGEILANLGFHVVAIDAYLHGERIEPWFSSLDNKDKYKYIIDIIIETGNNANSLWINHFSKNEMINNDSFYAFGVSMGAAITFYLSTITNKLSNAVTLVGSPSFVWYMKDKIELYNWDESEFSEKNKKYEALDPLLNIEKTKNTNFLIQLGLHDNVVDPKYSLAFVRENRNNTILKVYDTAHMSTSLMLEDAYQFLINKKG